MAFYTRPQQDVKNKHTFHRTPVSRKLGAKPNLTTRSILFVTERTGTSVVVGGLLVLIPIGNITYIIVFGEQIIYLRQHLKIVVLCAL